MNEQTKRFKILTNSGFKYSGTLIEQDSLWVVLNDDRQGKIQIPLVNISFMEELSQ